MQYYFGFKAVKRILLDIKRDSCLFRVLPIIIRGNFAQILFMFIKIPKQQL